MKMKLYKIDIEKGELYYRMDEELFKTYITLRNSRDPLELKKDDITLPRYMIYSKNNNDLTVYWYRYNPFLYEKRQTLDNSWDYYSILEDINYNYSGSSDGEEDCMDSFYESYPQEFLEFLRNIVNTIDFDLKRFNLGSIKENAVD